MQNIILSIIGTMFLLYGAVQLTPTGLNYIKIDKANSLVKQQDEIFEAVKRYIIDTKEFPDFDSPSTTMPTILEPIITIQVGNGEQPLRKTKEEDKLNTASPNSLTTKNYITLNKLTNNWDKPILISINKELGTLVLTTTIPDEFAKSMFLKSTPSGYKPTVISNSSTVQTTYIIPSDILSQGNQAGLLSNAYRGNNTPPTNSIYKFWYDTSAGSDKKAVLKIKDDDNNWHILQDDALSSSWEVMNDKNTVNAKTELPDEAKEGEFRYLYNETTGTVDLYSYHNNSWNLVLSINNTIGCLVANKLLLSAEPIKGAVNVDINTPLVLKFSQDMLKTSLDSSINITPNPILDRTKCTYVADATTNEYSYVCPLDNLTKDTTYRVDLSDSVKNSSSIGMCKPLTYTFRTNSCSTQNLIKSISPNNNPQNISYATNRTTTISMTFTTDMDPNTLGFETYSTTTNVKPTFNSCAYTAATKTYSCKVKNLVADTSYSFIIKAGAKSKNGWTICNPAQYQIKFKTRGQCEPEYSNDSVPIKRDNNNIGYLYKRVSFIDTNNLERVFYLWRTNQPPTTTDVQKMLYLTYIGWLSGFNSTSPMGQGEIRGNISGSNRVLTLKLLGRYDGGWKELMKYGSEGCIEKEIIANKATSHWANVRIVWTSTQIVKKDSLGNADMMSYPIDFSDYKTPSEWPDKIGDSKYLINSSSKFYYPIVLELTSPIE